MQAARLVRASSAACSSLLYAKYSQGYRPDASSVQSFFLFAECASDPVTGLSATTGRYEVIRLGGFFASRGTLPLYSLYCTGMADREGAPSHDCLLDARTPEQTPNPPHYSSLRGVLSQAEAHEPCRVMDCTIWRSESTGSADTRAQYASRLLRLSGWR